MGLKVAVIGATGLVGRELLKILEQRGFPVDSLHLYASDRSVGQKLPFKGDWLEVKEAIPEYLAPTDLVFFCADAAVSRQLVPRLARSRTVVIDNSSAFRLDPQVPLVVPEVNPGDLERHQGIIANPNCSTIQMVVALYPLHRVNPIRRIVVSTYQAVSGTGEAAVAELKAQVKAQVEERELPRPRVYPHPIAFNLFPFVDRFQEEGYTTEEWKMVNETRKILGAPTMAISATCVRVPVYVAHSEAITLELSRPMDPEEAREVLAGAPGVQVMDDPESNQFPTPNMAAGHDKVFVGRIRRDLSHPRGLVLWVVADNLRKGAALNAVQIAEEMVRRELL